MPQNITQHVKSMVEEAEKELDNMSVEDMSRAVGIVNGRVKLEASGNVTLDTVRAIAETGVDYISTGAITHSVKALDISLWLDDAPVVIPNRCAVRNPT